MSLKQISIFVENKPGKLCDVTELLAKHGIDMRALSLAETTDFGIVRIIADDVFKATTVLKDEGFIHNVSSVLGVAIPDEPGGLHRVLEVLREAGINVEYMYAFLGGKSVDHAYMIFKTADPSKAEIVLAANGISVLDQEDIEAL